MKHKRLIAVLSLLVAGVCWAAPSSFTTLSPFSNGGNQSSLARAFNPFGVAVSEAPAYDIEVADANARLSIDPTGKVAGYEVHQIDNDTIYEFQGAGADADAGLWVTGSAGSDGAYQVNGTNDGKNLYQGINPVSDIL